MNDMRPEPGPSRAYQLGFGRMSVFVACVILIGALALPANGLGFEVCILKRTLDVPCPGCGMTRSVRAVFHADPRTAWHFNPFGIALLPWVVLAASSLAWPARWRAGLEAWLGRHDRTALRVGAVWLVAFLIYGFVRMPLVGFGVWPRI